MVGGITVLSLFDGGSFGQVALSRTNVRINEFFASEIDPTAIKLTQHHHPKTKHLGDVRGVHGKYLPKIDLLMGGSPCQSFSFAGKQLNFDDPRGQLLFEFVRILKEVKPKFFLLENVEMNQRSIDIISQHLGVKPVTLNSTRTSAQNRVRLYWTNFHIEQPKDMGIKLEDILEHGLLPNTSVIKGELRKASIMGRKLNALGKREDDNKNLKRTQCLEVWGSNREKSSCITTVSKDTVLTTLPIGRHPDAYLKKLPFRNYTKTERCRLMNLPDDYCDILSENQTVKITGNGWDVGMLTHIFNQMLTNGVREKTNLHDPQPNSWRNLFKSKHAV